MALACRGGWAAGLQAITALPIQSLRCLPLFNPSPGSHEEWDLTDDGEQIHHFFTMRWRYIQKRLLGSYQWVLALDGDCCTLNMQHSLDQWLALHEDVVLHIRWARCDQRPACAGMAGCPLLCLPATHQADCLSVLAPRGFKCCCLPVHLQARLRGSSRRGVGPLNAFWLLLPGGVDQARHECAGIWSGLTWIHLLQADDPGCTGCMAVVAATWRQRNAVAED